jgi:hypothetical protein
MRKFEQSIKRMHIIISEKDYKRLQDVAQSKMTNVSNIVREILSDFLDAEEKCDK